MEQKTFGLIVVGSRNFNNIETVDTLCDKALSRVSKEGYFITIICGGCKGVDSIAVHYARRHGLNYKVYGPNWDKYGKAAGPIRNKIMAERAKSDYDECGCIAIRVDHSAGTTSMIDCCEKKGVPCHVLDVEKKHRKE